MIFDYLAISGLVCEYHTCCVTFLKIEIGFPSELQSDHNTLEFVTGCCGVGIVFNNSHDTFLFVYSNVMLDAQKGGCIEGLRPKHFSQAKKHLEFRHFEIYSHMLTSFALSENSNCVFVREGWRAIETSPTASADKPENVRTKRQDPF